MIDGGLYWYQQEWSNEGEACRQRMAQPPTVSKLTPKKGPGTGGTSVTITGTDFAAPATVKFGAVAGSEVHVSSSTSITVTSPAESDGTVDVTVTTNSGTSAVNKKDRFKYKK